MKNHVILLPLAMSFRGHSGADNAWNQPLSSKASVEKWSQSKLQTAVSIVYFHGHWQQDVWYGVFHTSSKCQGYALSHHWTFWHFGLHSGHFEPPAPASSVLFLATPHMLSPWAPAWPPRTTSRSASKTRASQGEQLQPLTTNVAISRQLYDTVSTVSAQFQHSSAVLCRHHVFLACICDSFRAKSTEASRSFSSGNLTRQETIPHFGGTPAQLTHKKIMEKLRIERFYMFVTVCSMFKAGFWRSKRSMLNGFWPPVPNIFRFSSAASRTLRSDSNSRRSSSSS